MIDEMARRYAVSEREKFRSAKYPHPYPQREDDEVFLQAYEYAKEQRAKLIAANDSSADSEAILGTAESSYREALMQRVVRSILEARRGRALADKMWRDIWDWHNLPETLQRGGVWEVYETAHAAVAGALPTTERWRLFETAPKDGTEVLLYFVGWQYAPLASFELDADSEEAIYAWRFKDDFFGEDGDGWLHAEDLQPTHWIGKPQGIPESD